MSLYNSKILFTLLGVIIAAMTLFYNMTLKPNIDYFQTLTKDVVKLRLSTGYINDICLAPDLERNTHFYKYIERRNIEREEILTKIISDGYLLKQIISGNDFNEVRDFVRWNDKQYMHYILTQQCPDVPLAPQELLNWQNRITTKLPYGVLGNLKHLYRQF